MLVNKEMYVACEGECIRLTVDSVSSIEELTCSHEEADTRMILHANHAVANNYKTVVIDTPDTDVFIIALYHSCHINRSLYIKTGVKNKRRYISLDAIKEKLKVRYKNSMDITDICDALVAYHAFTGCDAVSAFCGRGKIKPLKTLLNNDEFIATFQMLGSHWQLSEYLLSRIEMFTCHMYGKFSSDVNETRYKMYCASNGPIDSECLPPCHNALQLHTQRANYISKIWKMSLEANLEVPSPVEHGWIYEGENLAIKWVSVRAAPDEILELMACTCPKKCITGKCCCIDNCLKCTDLCKIKCDNMEEVKDDVSVLGDDIYDGVFSDESENDSLIDSDSDSDDER